MPMGALPGNLSPLGSKSSTTTTTPAAITGIQQPVDLPTMTLSNPAQEVQ
jgi:hypothetical protein